MFFYVYKTKGQLKTMDKQTFTSIFITLREKLKAVSRHYIENDEEVDDALQDTFIRLWNRTETIENKRQAEGTLITTIKNICIDNIRHSAKHKTEEIDSLPDFPEYEDNAAETLYDVTNIIEHSLTKQQREILYQRDRDGWEFDEIARYHHTTEANIRVILSRTRKKVREIYNNYGTIR